MSKFAAATDVSADKSRAEIERNLTRYGATGFMYGWQGNNAVVAFEMVERRIKFMLPLPPKDSPEFRRTPGGRRSRSPEDALRAWEQAGRQRWRALALVIKAKLEAVESGITEFEDEFMAHIVMPDGKTVSQHARPMIANAYNTGQMQPLLPAPSEPGPG